MSAIGFPSPPGTAPDPGGISRPEMEATMRAFKDWQIEYRSNRTQGVAPTFWQDANANDKFGVALDGSKLEIWNYGTPPTLETTIYGGDPLNCAEYNLLDEGIIPDGNTDNTAAMNALIAKLNLNPFSTVIVPRGITNIAGQLDVITASGISFVGATNAKECLFQYSVNHTFRLNGSPNLVTNGDFSTNDDTGWTFQSGSPATFTNGRLEITGAATGYIQDVVVPVGVEQEFTFDYPTGEYGIAGYLYDGAGFGVPLAAAVQSAVVTSTTGIIRIYLYAGGPVTSKVDNVRLRNRFGANWCNFMNIGWRSPAITTNYAIWIGRSSNIHITDNYLEPSVGGFVEIGDWLGLTPSYIIVEGLDGVCANVATSMIEVKSCVNVHYNHSKVRPNADVYEPINPDGNETVLGRHCINADVQHPAIIDTIFAHASDTFVWDVFCNLKVAQNPVTAAATAIGPVRLFANTLDSCRSASIKAEIGANTYLKELTYSDNYTSAMDGSGIEIFGAGDIRAAKFADNRLRTMGVHGFHIHGTGDCHSLQFSGNNAYDADFNEGGGAAVIYIEGSANYDGVNINDNMLAVKEWNQADGGTPPPRKPDYGIRTTGAIANMIVTANNTRGSIANIDTTGAVTPVVANNI